MIGKLIKKEEKGKQKSKKVGGMKTAKQPKKK